MYGMHPAVNIVDVTHFVEQFNTLQASFVIRSCYSDFPGGTVHMISVSNEFERGPACLAAHVNGHYFVLPDSGLLTMIHGCIPEKVVKVSPEFSHDAYKTFPEKFIFSKAACHLAKGGDLSDLGDPFHQVVEKYHMSTTYDNHGIHGSIVYIDNYGNAITNIPRDLFNEIGKGRRFLIRMKRNDHQIDEISDYYSTMPPGEKLALFNSDGMLEIALAFGDASKLLYLRIHDNIRIDFI
jgi:S-adenosylmethionine hydrolase